MFLFILLMLVYRYVLYPYVVHDIWIRYVLYAAICCYMLLYVAPHLDPGVSVGSSHHLHTPKQATD